MYHHWSLADARLELEREQDPDRRAALEELLALCNSKGLRNFRTQQRTPDPLPATEIRALARVVAGHDDPHGHQPRTTGA